MSENLFGFKRDPHPVLRGLDWLLYLALFLLTAGMLVVVAAQVYYRFVMNNPLDWSEEVARYLFVWLSFLGSAVGVKHRVHLGVDTIEKIMSPRKYRYVALLVNAVIAAFLLGLIRWGFQVIEVVSLQSSPAMGISMLYPYLAVPVGCLFMLVNLVRVSLEIWHGQGSSPTIKAEDLLK